MKDFTINITFEAGIFAVDAVINKIRAFCFKESLQCEFFKSGLITKNVECVIKGRGTTKYAYAVREAILDFLFRLQDTINS